MEINKVFETMKDYEDYKNSNEALEQDKYSYIVCKVKENNKIYILQSTPLAVDDCMIQARLFNVLQDLNEELNFTENESDFADTVEEISNLVYEFLSTAYGIEIDQVTTDF